MNDKPQRAGWFRVKSSGALVRASEAAGFVRLVSEDRAHPDTNDYNADAFEWIGAKPC